VINYLDVLQLVRLLKANPHSPAAPVNKVTIDEGSGTIGVSETEGADQIV